jgi:hypothetical protein
MALGAAAWAVGLPLEPIAGVWAPTTDDESALFIPGTDGVDPATVTYQACDTWDQGRAVVALWLAAQASPTTEAHLRGQIEAPHQNPVIETVESDGGSWTIYSFWDIIGVGQPYPWFALEFYKREAYYAYQLLDQPSEKLGDAIRANWDILTDPDTTTVEAVVILGEEPLADYEERNEGPPYPESKPPCP